MSRRSNIYRQPTQLRDMDKTPIAQALLKQCNDIGTRYFNAGWVKSIEGWPWSHLWKVPTNILRDVAGHHPYVKRLIQIREQETKS